ncbi:MAG: hypothetical protein RSD78_05460, partial [Oscillospiraceae bacterium]
TQSASFLGYSSNVVVAVCKIEIVPRCFLKERLFYFLILFIAFLYKIIKIRLVGGGITLD